MFEYKVESEYTFFDTHCHLDFPPFCDDLQQTLARARAGGVKFIMVPSIGAKNWHSVIQLADLNIGIYCALGFHPYYIDQHRVEQKTEFESLIASLVNNEYRSSCVAIGESGLDFSLPQETHDQQVEWLIYQIEIANRYQLPLICHSRKSHHQLIQLLRRHPVTRGGVIHGFSGSLQQAEQFIELGFYIGVGGTITYPRAKKTISTIKNLPLTALLLESDAPDMPVNGFQGEANRSERVVMTFKALLSIRDEEDNQVAYLLFENGRRLFNL
ncbi:TatD family hydrolase [Vibrio sp. SS-MA-C1-2]|uniref:TatD family hydrolase n=1 Tax=Vibrio sp. SS-MA-C1-2 TaxID=2908646 RepID=UPI001F177259|nr:TatD family hydrolase [Vibrio sp. SS-MA-C1-2]UJF19715.1 TatD family hydrolase [Vibrio sp. SS-MA-C1-2]